MATMGVLHGYYVAEYRIICRDGVMGDIANMLQDIALFAKLGQCVDTQSTLLGGCWRI
jgi:hypothetical protein